MLLRERVPSDSIERLRAAVAEYNNVCYANSLGSESMVLTDLIWGAVPANRNFQHRHRPAVPGDL